MKILLVCSGNVSRSFLAEVLLKRELRSLGAEDIAVSSAGIYAYPGSPPDPRMVDYLAKAGIAYEPHEARGVTQEEVERADLIIVMEKNHASTIESSWPEAAGKVELFGKFVSGDWTEDDVIDPYGKSPYHYRVTQSQISLGVQNLARRVVQDAQNKGHCR
jgi:protein-tyrosine phosphatase